MKNKKLDSTILNHYRVIEVNYSNNSWVRKISFNLDEELIIKAYSETGSIFIFIAGIKVGVFDQYEEKLTPINLPDCERAIESIKKSNMMKIIKICICEYERMLKLGCLDDEIY